MKPENDLLLVVGQDLSDGMIDQFVTAEETSKGSLKKEEKFVLHNKV